MDKFSFLGSAHTELIDNMYHDFLKDPKAVNKEWHDFFQGFDFAQTTYLEEDIPKNFQKEFKVLDLIDDYRHRGHLFTQTNPVRERRKYLPTLDIHNYGLSEEDLNTIFQAGNEVGIGASTLSDIINHLKKVYCQSIGVEYMYIKKTEEVDWIKNKLHKNSNTPKFTIKEKKHILHKLNQAVSFENFLHRKYVGQKRFSLEGAESLIPALDALIEHASELGVKEFVMGMAHRGRLNVLANIFNKTYKDIFSEFEGNEYEDDLIAGDVKYHLGFTSEKKCANGNTVRLNLSPNPSHLEAVDPVVEGISRAKIDRAYNSDVKKVIPILLHGDAALAGQGIVYEVIQMSNLDGYKTGGTIHIVINNQVGFTTNYHDARTSIYCTDIAKVTLSPVFHVNGDDVEAVVHTLKIATEYRQKFHKDVFIDLLCYRKYGHNEGDEPRFTQPLLYKLIAQHPNAREIYQKRLIKEGVVKANIVDKLKEEFKKFLEQRFDQSKEIKKSKITSFLKNEWDGFQRSLQVNFKDECNTSVDIKILKDIAEYLYNIPNSKKLFKKTQKLLQDRKEMISNNKLDWSMGELLAYASLLKEGFNIRVSGQDVERGTFSHRHAILKIEESEDEISPLSFVNKNVRFEIYNSHLSEYGVLGFDYGYSIVEPNTLTIWEAQFGDFSNGAQIMIDQFISCAEDKWKIMSGIVLLLPHGYEGQGAEHSSARMERYLQLCAQNNIQIVNCTTPANFFHVLRRQLKRNFRKPLIVFTPKSLLRSKYCTSTLEEFSKDNFKMVIEDNISKNQVIEKLVLCSGKIYYDLLRERDSLKNIKTALVRIEQLYPFPINKIESIIKKYMPDKIIWVQEEPENMGAWTYILSILNKYNISVISRNKSAATASGSPKYSKLRQKKLIDKVFKS